MRGQNVYKKKPKWNDSSISKPLTWRHWSRFKNCNFLQFPTAPRIQWFQEKYSRTTISVLGRWAQAQYRLSPNEITLDFICFYNVSHIFKLHRRGLRSIVALLPLLGVTYVVGFSIEFHLALGYVFILLNSSQVCKQKV